MGRYLIQDTCVIHAITCARHNNPNTIEREIDMNTNTEYPVSDDTEYMKEELQRQGKCVCVTCVNAAHADSIEQWVERYAL